MKYLSSHGRKQRKTLYNLKWHQKRKKMGVHLDNKLIEKYHIRSIPVRKGDTVKVVRGDADMVGHEAKIAVVNIPEMKVVVEGLTLSKADGKQKQKWVDPSNVIITKLDLSDPKRRKRIEKRGKLTEGELKPEVEVKPVEEPKTEMKNEETQSTEEKKETPKDDILDEKLDDDEEIDDEPDEESTTKDESENL